MLSAKPINNHSNSRSSSQLGLVPLASLSSNNNNRAVAYSVVVVHLVPISRNLHLALVLARARLAQRALLDSRANNHNHNRLVLVCLVKHNRSHKLVQLACSVALDNKIKPRSSEQLTLLRLLPELASVLSERIPSSRARNQQVASSVVVLPAACSAKMLNSNHSNSSSLNKGPVCSVQPPPSHNQAGISLVEEPVSSEPPISNNNSSSQVPSLNNRIRSATCLVDKNLQRPHKQGAICSVVRSVPPSQRKHNLPWACLAALRSGNSLRPNKQPTHLAEVGCSVA